MFLCWVLRIRWQSASHPIALMSLMYYYHSFVVCRYDETESAGCEFPHKVHTHSNLCVCVRMLKCSFICLLVYDFKYSHFSSHAPLLVCCVRSERVNQLNYLWWWINRFVFRWRAQLAALSTTNCRRIEWWNLERERVLGQSQCYSWFRGFFLTQQSWTLWETR